MSAVCFADENDGSDFVESRDSNSGMTGLTDGSKTSENSFSTGDPSMKNSHNAKDATRIPPIN